jgi:serine/threonine protein kinase
MNPQNLVGKKIGGRYEIDLLLGQGGMSEVYRAYDPNLRRKVAIKLIHSYLATDPKFINRFKEEAAAVARLRHSNIVQVYDFDFDGQNYYMVMEYLEGDTLQFRLKRQNSERRYLPLSEAVKTCIQLCDAVGYAHSHNLIHRDIKPANVIIDLTGHAILMDFGIVKIIGGDYHTATGASVGTATYMSPEQIRGERVDMRTDIYSLGVTLYEMLSGKPPFQGDSAFSLMMTVLNSPLPDLGSYRKDIPADLQQIVEKSMSKTITERYQSMEEMAAALQHIFPHLPIDSPSYFVPEEKRAGQLDNKLVEPQKVTEVDEFNSIEMESSWLDLEMSSSSKSSPGTTIPDRTGLITKPPDLPPIAKIIWKEESALKQMPITSRGVTIGRSAENDLPVKDIAASRFHCKILPEGGELTLVDLESTNGTLLNNVRVNGTTQIQDGDKIHIGKQEYRIEILPIAKPDDTLDEESTKKVSSKEAIYGINDHGVPCLTICDGVGIGTTFTLLDNRYLIGGASQSKQWDIDLVDQSVSRPHAELILQDDSWILRDLGSENGTTINGRLIKKEKVLKDGDRIGFGNTLMIFRRNSGE